MKIYVVEGLFDYTVQLYWAADKEVAQKKADEFNKEVSPYHKAYVAEYELNNEGWCEFCND